MHNLDHSSYYVGTDGLHFSPYSSLFIWTLMLGVPKNRVWLGLYTLILVIQQLTHKAGWMFHIIRNLILIT